MKRYILFLLFVFAFDTEYICQHYLRFTGNVQNASTLKGLKKAKIEVLNSRSLLIIKTFTKDSGDYKFRLPLDTADIYLVKISYPKFVSKLYTISTKGISKKALETLFAEIEASVSLFKPVPNVDYKVLEEPLNRYYYDSIKDNYAYDKPYLESSLAKLIALKNREAEAKKENALKKQNAAKKSK